MMKRYCFALAVIWIASACETDNLKPENKDLTLELPEIPYDYVFDNNSATLGRVLFYDKQLSINNAISCASCHKQSIAFTDNNQFSRGFDNRLTGRNSMPIQNLISSSDFNGSFFSAGLFWDGRGQDHSKSLLLPIINHVEMGVPSIEYLEQKIKSIDYYQELFNNAFADGQINSENISNALFSFTHSIVSSNSKLDKSLRGQVELSPNELLGQELFFSKYQCNSCHQVQDPQGYLFAGTFANIGLESDYDDSGLELTTERDFDNGKFKIPSLRNVSLTAPYMHDGRFETLEEVIGHYKSEVVDHPNLDSRLRELNGAPKRPNISENEVQAIIDFLGTLTDYSLLTEEKFSNPFKVSQ